MTEPEHIKHFRELGFTVVAEPDAYLVKFGVYEIEGWLENAGPFWHRAGSATHPDWVETLGEAELYLHGEVKWDGCSNWHFDEQDRVMLHGCSRAHLTQIGEIMAACWDWAGELCPNWNA